MFLKLYVFSKQMMVSNLRGELTGGKTTKMEDYDLVDAVARSLHISSPQELSQLGLILFPAMINSAVRSNDIPKLDTLKSYGADLSATNYDHRTALHLACIEGNEQIAKHLLLNGVSVHVRDRYDRTPLMEAISIDAHSIIALLIKCGAHLTGSARVIGENLVSIAARGAINRMESYRLAGADLSQPDPSGRTALHVAALHGHAELVKYLLERRVDRNEKDMLGLTPLDYAKLREHNGEIVNILNPTVEIENGIANGV